MLHSAPVSPPLQPLPLEATRGGGGADQAPAAGEEAGVEEVNMKHVVKDAQPIGVEGVLHDSRGPGALQAVPMPSPPTMSPAEKAKHDLTHLPPHPGCAICRSTRAPNLGHPRSHEHLRVIPLLVGDYCFLKNALEKTLATCLVLRLYPYGIFFAFLVPRKG